MLTLAPWFRDLLRAIPACVLLAGPVSFARAQTPEIPCDYPMYDGPHGGSGAGAPPGNNWLSDGRIDLLLDPDQEHPNPNIQSDEGRIQDRQDRLRKNYLPVVARLPGFEFSYRWRAGLTFTHSTPDVFEGEPAGIEGTDVDLLELEIGRLFLAGRERASELGIRIPFLALDAPAARDHFDASGLSDVTIYLALGLGTPGGSMTASQLEADQAAQPWRQHPSLELAVSLPTGDDAELLGTGDFSGRIGFRHAWRKSLAPLRSLKGKESLTSMFSNLEVHAMLEGVVDPATQENLAPEPPRQPGLHVVQVQLGIAYEHDFADEELSYVELSAGVHLGWQRTMLDIGVQVQQEVGDGPSSGARDAAFQAELSATFRVALQRKHYRAWYLGLTARTALGDDGLRDRFTPSIELQYLWN